MRLMNITLICEDTCPRMILKGSMPLDLSATLEGSIVGAMRRYRHRKVNLLGAYQIDQSGGHSYRLLQGVCGSKVDIVATSPAIEQASWRHLLPRAAPAAAASRRPFRQRRLPAGRQWERWHP